MAEGEEDFWEEEEPGSGRIDAVTQRRREAGRHTRLRRRGERGEQLWVSSYELIGPSREPA